MAPELRWSKRLIAAESFESACAVDVDGDGVLDIVSGEYWYRGPDFLERTRFAEDSRYGEYWDDFATIPLAIPGIEGPAIVTGGWFGEDLRVRAVRDQGEGGFRQSVVARPGNVEHVLAFDVDGSGELAIVPNVPGGPLAIFRPGLTIDDPWAEEVLWAGPQGHGLGYGDISGQGTGDFVMSTGWLQRPGADGEPWRFHDGPDLGDDASVPILAVDLRMRGRADLIVGSGHGRGLVWWENPGDGGSWRRHEIDTEVSQCHSLRWADIDGDGAPELVTGKRWRAHPEGDEGQNDDLGIWYFTWNGSAFEKHVVDEGPPGSGVGVGLGFDLVDLNGNGYLDIIAPGKDGLWLLSNHGPS